MSSRLMVVLAILIASMPAHGQTPPLVAQARRYVEQHPAVSRQIGLAEILRSHGLKQDALAELRQAARKDGSAELHALICWRMLPVAPADHEAWREHLTRLKAHAPEHPWLATWERCLAPRTAFDKATSVPDQFPYALAEQAHFTLLQELGWSRLHAALEVIAARSHEPLYALRDLDRALSREADFLRSLQRDAEADRLRVNRDRLRQAYAVSAHHLVEKLFAFHLLGNTKERDALLARAKAIPYLHDRARLAHLLERLDEDQAWSLVVEPMFKSELALIAHPPGLGAVKGRPIADVRIQSEHRTVQGKTTTFEGGVQFRLHGRDVQCDHLTLLHTDDPATLIFSGSGKVQVHGLHRYPGGVRADRFTFHAETGAFAFSGDVRLHGDKLIRLRACTLMPDGELRDARSWLDDFKHAFDMPAKIELLPKIARTYRDDELPDEVRFMLALHTLRPHLTWHAPYPPPLPRRDREPLRSVRDAARHEDDASAWNEALVGEAWMNEDVPASAKEAFRGAIAAWYRPFQNDPLFKGIKPPELPAARAQDYFWRLRDPHHADVARTRKLLAGVKGEELQRKARRWLAEIDRNNTVLTFDIAGAGVKDAPHSLVMDVRNADRVSFKLYRVKHPDELLATLDRIGEDFVYQDHGLNLRGQREDLVQIEKVVRRQRDQVSRGARPAPPSWTKEQLVQQWEACPAELPAAATNDRWRRLRRHSWHHEDADADYFDDACSIHRSRLDKVYRPQTDDMLSSWQCDRIVQIPAEALREAGGYVLVAESNGQVAQAPILVEPLSLTLRRCRDGVFALVSDADGRRPIEGAKVQAPGDARSPTAITDKEGVAFLRVLATGDRPILAHHQSRFAIGGFGQVFEGIYDAPGDDRGERPWIDQLERARKALDKEHASAFVYGDQHVIVAYTDRPTYRPGQDVQFKLIVRKQVRDHADEPARFRADDFDATTKLTLPKLDQPVRYTTLDARGHEVASGLLRLNDFGTAAGKFTLDAETGLGAYSLRVHVADQDRLVPDVFAVQHYRRPNFDIQVLGLPEKAVKAGPLKLKIASHYYFGPPVSGGAAEVRVLRGTKQIVRIEQRLGPKGQAEVELSLPATLAGGGYAVVCNVTDGTGRTMTRSLPLEIEAPAGTPGLAGLPRFVPVGADLRIATTAKEVHVTHQADKTQVAVRDGAAMVPFRAPGWYRLRAGDDETRIFAYGGDRHPLHHENDVTDREPIRWVNLSDFSWEHEGRFGRWERPSQYLFALFDRRQVNVGDRLRLLVYVPTAQPAKLLFTFEGRTIFDYAVVGTNEKAGAYQVVEVPISRRCFPNFYLQGRILAGDEKRASRNMGEFRLRVREARDDDGDRDHDPRWCRIDVADPSRRMETPSLEVALETDRPNYRPGDEVRANVRITRRDGKPQPAELSFAAIDESVFAFGEDGLAALPSFFRAPQEVRRFRPKAWRVSIGSKWAPPAKGQVQHMQNLERAIMADRQDLTRAQTAELLHDRLEPYRIAVPLPRLGGELPLGEMPTARLRKHFQETAAWLPQIRTDDTGQAEVAFTLADSLTRYRLTAVALTKSGDVGVGRGTLTAALPLAVQVMLPRFAIEKDRLQAVAILHNTTDQPRECRIEWNVEGATAESATPQPRDWTLKNEKGRFVGTGFVAVPAQGTATVKFWLMAERLGVAQVRFSARAGKDADAEVRTLPIQPLGRSAEFAANRTLPIDVLAKAGQFNQQGRIALPAGFLARDLVLNVHASDLAQALDGLEDLVDYPHGCIEQTMSRFMPLVMVRHATMQTPLKLTPTMEAKLPEVLQSGLLRVYNLQKPDGSWGWFEKDERNNPMTIYVVYGLARCQATGTRINADVLRRGCRYLHGELQANRLSPDDAARAWHALGLAGHADRVELETVARRTLTQPPRQDVLCHLALACREVGLAELGERLWAKVGVWHAHDTPSLALLLKTQLAFGRPYLDCRATARSLLSLRQGTRWSHTRDTAAAIEALASMLAYVPDRLPVRRVQVTLAGKTVLDLRDPAELRKLVYRVRLTSADLPTDAGIELRVQADGDEPVQVAMRAQGVQRQDELQPSGQAIKLERVIETIDGEPLHGPLKMGQSCRVRLRLTLEHRMEYLLVEDRRPASCEFADDRVHGEAAGRLAHQEFRDDRLCLFFAALGPGTHEIVYYLRAETAGECTMLPGCAYPMYNDRLRGESGASKIAVVP